MVTHSLKTWIPYYEDILRDFKKFDLRKDDRNFQVGDCLLLQEYDQNAKTYTGREHRVLVTYKLPGGSFGLESGYCILGIEPLKRGTPYA